jgi:hypothetical protein
MTLLPKFIHMATAEEGGLEWLNGILRHIAAEVSALATRLTSSAERNRRARSPRQPEP